MAQILNPESSSQCFQQFAVLKRNLNIKVKCIQAEFNEKLIDFVNTHLFNYLDNVFEDFLSNNLSKFDHTHIQGEPIKLDSFTSERIDSSSLIVEADEDDIQKIDETQPHYETTASIAESTSCENTNVQRSTCSELRGPSLYLQMRNLRGVSLRPAGTPSTLSFSSQPSTIKASSTSQNGRC